jgi:hypothetical protein
MKGCYSGADFSRDIAMGLKLRNIETTKVSSRLGVSKIEQSGRVMVDNRYHLDEGKVVWGYKDGEFCISVEFLECLPVMSAELFTTSVASSN